MPAFRRLAAGVATLGFFAAVALPRTRREIAPAARASDGAWAKALADQHARIRARFDKLLETRDDQAARREMLLARLARALTRHAIAEEYVIYPALMESVRRDDARRLFDDHGEIKHFIYDLRRIPAADPRWLGAAQEFRAHLDAHFQVEETEVFPSFQDALSPEANRQLARMLKLEGARLG
jgi:hemerythrin-like domain-containing protein